MKRQKQLKSRKLNRKAYKLEKNISKNIRRLQQINYQITHEEKPIAELWKTGMRIIGYIKSDFEFIGQHKYQISNNRRYYYNLNLNDFKTIYTKFKKHTKEYYIEHILKNNMG